MVRRYGFSMTGMFAATKNEGDAPFGSCCAWRRQLHAVPTGPVTLANQFSIYLLRDSLELVELVRSWLLLNCRSRSGVEHFTDRMGKRQKAAATVNGQPKAEITWRDAGGASARACVTNEVGHV